MIRLTTPKHKFTFPQNTDTYKKVIVSYRQGQSIVLEKISSKNQSGELTGDLTFETEIVNGVVKYIGWCRLSQEETKSFKAGCPVELQVRVLDDNDNAYASDIFSLDVQQVLNTDII